METASIGNALKSFLSLSLTVKIYTSHMSYILQDSSNFMFCYIKLIKRLVLNFKFCLLFYIFQMLYDYVFL